MSLLIMGTLACGQLEKTYLPDAFTPSGWGTLAQVGSRYTRDMTGIQTEDAEECQGSGGVWWPTEQFQLESRICLSEVNLSFN